MNENETGLPETVQHEDSRDKVRGRIPKGAWSYVRGQYELAGRTYQEIGDEFNCTPSAVFYVVKQARDREIEPSLERPSEDMMRAARAGEKVTGEKTAGEKISERATNDFSWASRKVRDVTAPAQPSQVEKMAEQANAMLTNETCKRLFDATSNTIVSFVGFEAAPDNNSKKMAKDAIHEVRRALASLELKIEMMPLSAPQATAPRMPEIA